MNIRVKVYGFVALVVVALGVWYLAANYYPGEDVAKADFEVDGSNGDADEEASVPVRLEATRQGPISSFLTSTSNLRPLRDVVLTTQATGVVKEVLVEEGDQVENGRLLCLLDDTELLIRLKLTEQKLAQAKLQLEKAHIRERKAQIQIANTKVELARKEDAYAEKLVSEEEVATLRYRVQELEQDERVAASEVREFGHRVEELRAEGEQVELEVSRTRILAPFGGYITHRTVEIGQTVRNLDNLFRLGAFSPLFADVHLSEREASRVNPGQTAMVSLGSAGTDQIQGKVVRISPIVDDATGTVKITVNLPPSGKSFKPGAFVRVDIKTDTRLEALLIPKRALLEEDGQDFVFVVQGTTANRRNITLGYSDDQDIEVRQGVSAGERVVVAGQGNLTQGAKVRIVGS